jgi:methylglutamate dehydrogenase subunit D
MSDPSLQHRSALAGIIRPGRIGITSGVAGVVARELQGFAAVSILAHKGQAVATAALLSEHLAATVTDGSKRVARGSLSVSGIAPGQWFAIERDPARPTLSALRAGLIGLAAVVDQSDGRIVVELTGERVRNALAKGIPVDLDAGVCKPGDVAQTMASHIGVQVSLMTEQPAFEVVTAASTAASFWTWLVTSAAEYGLDVV